MGSGVTGYTPLGGGGKNQGLKGWSVPPLPSPRRISCEAQQSEISLPALPGVWVSWRWEQVGLGRQDVDFGVPLIWAKDRPAWPCPAGGTAQVCEPPRFPGSQGKRYLCSGCPGVPPGSAAARGGGGGELGSAATWGGASEPPGGAVWVQRLLDNVEWMKENVLRPTFHWGELGGGAFKAGDPDEGGRRYNWRRGGEEQKGANYTYTAHVLEKGNHRVCLGKGLRNDKKEKCRRQTLRSGSWLVTIWTRNVFPIYYIRE